MKRLLLSLIFLSSMLSLHAQDISIAGKWSVRLDTLDIGKKKMWQNELFGGQSLNLPGTMDEGGIGKTNNLDTLSINKAVLISLSRKHRYIGVAWYQKEITLTKAVIRGSILLERVIWKTDCWIDGVYLGSAHSLSTAHQFELSNLKSGKHTIVLRIDNSKQFDISFNDFAHAYTDGTQIMWNGVIGEMKIIPSENFRLDELQVYTDPSTKSVEISVGINGIVPLARKKIRYKIFKKGKLLASKVFPIEDDAKLKNILRKISLKNVELWDEFNPNLYKLIVELVDSKSTILAANQTSFGFRKIGNDNGSLTLNNKRIFLRGTLDCNIYPDQGHPPMEKKGWIKVFNTIKQYGLNHVRYHSWCPPEAAFQVADSLGLYLQVELPLWSIKVGSDKPTLTFLQQESQRMISSYGNHPSFCFWSMGNELEGDFKWLNELVKQLKKQDNRRFYTATTFSFQKGHGLEPEPFDDFFITQYTKKGWIRGQGVFNAEVPNFDKDYRITADSIPVPIIAHEVGQYSIFPNLGEIKKYKGVLEPLNFKAVRYDLKKKGLLDLADSFKLASGKFAVILYKEEIERALKTNSLSGFQLLDLHDFPGQGTALVGLLDAFWESKGLIEPSGFKEFCSEVVPLLRYKKASFLNTENFTGSMEIANFGQGWINERAVWEVTDANKHVLYSGTTDKRSIGLGTSKLGDVSFSLSSIKKPLALTFTLKIENTSYKNSWDFWVYPAAPSEQKDKVLFTSSVQQALQALKDGRTVLLNPDSSGINGVAGRFTSVFWSPVHFPDQPGTMGILCNPQHPALNKFPTNFHSNWQWWDLITNSKTMVLDGLEGSYTPIVSVIDNFFKNRKMAVIIECKVGNGKLILCSMDIKKNLQQRIEAQQLRTSLMDYASSETFNPEKSLDESGLLKLLK